MKSRLSLTSKNFTALADHTGNIYENTMIISKRAKHIAMTTKEAFNNRLEAIEISPIDENLEEVVENKEQIKLSRTFEKRPKPITLAIDDFMNEGLMYHYPDASTEESKGATSELDN